MNSKIFASKSGGQFGTESHGQFNRNLHTECVKGMNYNGAIGISEDNEHVVFINREDYEQLEDVTSKYNTIIGRRDIIKDLYRRAGFV